MIQMASIEDFKKIELRVAEITGAERVPGTSKLLKLEINLGSEKRTIVAGIAADYPPETLPGRQVVVAANLEPKEVRGIKSEGMLLAADAGGMLSLATTDKKVPPGTLLR